MDYPKSVPGVGLVGGRFVDEDPASGRQGSLIPSDWGNLVTDEIISVIRAAGIDPSELESNQLLEALNVLAKNLIDSSNKFGIGNYFDFRVKDFHGALPPKSFFGKGTMFGISDGGNSAASDSLKIQGLAPESYGVLCIHGQWIDISAFSSLQRWFFTNDRYFISVATSADAWGPWRELIHSGNSAVSAQKLSTARKIAGVPFDATTDIDLPILGRNQVWTDVSELRLLDAIYTNTTGRTIALRFQSTSLVNVTATLSLFTSSGAGSRIVSFVSSSLSCFLVCNDILIPAGEQYKLHSDNSSFGVAKWEELR